MSDEQFFKSGVIVTDLEAAMAELGGTLHVEWTSIQAIPLVIRTPQGREEIELRVVISKSGPTYLELIEALPTGYYAAPNGSYLHHVGLWVDDIAGESARLESEGWPLEAAGEFDGKWPVGFAFHTSPWGMRLELGETSNRQLFEDWVTGRGLAL